VLTLDEAIAHVLREVPEPSPVEMPLGDASGHVLAQDVLADADMPAFDRSAMDGYAVRSADAASAGAKLRRVGESRPGGAPLTRSIEAGECAAIYTGGAVPPGADAVVMVERTREGGGVVELAVAVRAGENVRRQGEDARRGETLLERGQTMRPQEVAVCAFVGAHRVRVYAPPAVAVLASGDELVTHDATPGAGQIRDSNAPMLVAQVARAGARGEYLGRIADDRAATSAVIEAAAARAGVVLITGGVSMGKYDYVAPVLEEIGFAGGFHRVKVKPGKPVWFGRRGAVLAFGLPGNPVSAFVLFEVLVRPALHRLAGRAPGPRFEDRVLAGGPASPNDREQLVPARVGDDGRVTLLEWSSSADLVELARAGVLARIAPGRAVRPGDTLPVLPI